MLEMNAEKALLCQRNAEPAKSRQLYRRAPDVEAEDAAEKIQLDPLDPADCQSEIAAQRDEHAGPRSRETKPPPVIGIVFPNSGWRQHRFEFRHRVQNSLNKRVLVRPGPRAVIAVGPKPVILDHRPNFWDETFCLFPIDADYGLGHRAKPSPVRRKSIDANGFAPGSIVIAAIGGLATLLDDDPGVDSEDPAPAYRARRINSDQGIWMLQC